MKKNVLVIVLLALTQFIGAQADTKYLSGAVPEVDGKVVFSKTYSVPNTSKEEIFDKVYAWMETKLSEIGNDSRVVYKNKDEGTIAGLAKEYIVFKSTTLVLDRTLINYQLTVHCQDNACKVDIERIRFDYRENESFQAEEWITDEYALNKKKTKILRGFSKWRKGAIDFTDAIFDEVEHLLHATPQELTDLPIASTPTPKVVEHAIPLVTSKQEAFSAQELAGFQKIEAHKIPGNIIQLLDNGLQNIVLTTTKDSYTLPMSWGGLSSLFNKATAIAFLEQTPTSYEATENATSFTICFYTEAYREELQKSNKKVKDEFTLVTTPNGTQAYNEAWLIIECKKIGTQSITLESLTDNELKKDWIGKQLPKMILGEITNVWIKK